MAIMSYRTVWEETKKKNGMEKRTKLVMNER